MQKLQELRDMLCKELESLPDRGKLDTTGLQKADMLAHTIKNLDKITEKDGYSGNRYYYGERQRDSMGRYVGDASDGRGGYNDRGGYSSGYHDYAMDYSRDMADIKGELTEIMNSTDSPRTRQSLKQIIQNM